MHANRFALTLSTFVLLVGCGDTTNKYTYVTYVFGDTAEDGDTDGAGSSEDTGWMPVDPPTEISDNLNSTPDDIPLDLWTNGNVYWYWITGPMLTQMNEDWAAGDWDWDGLYDVEEEGEVITYADHLYICTGNIEACADYITVQTNIVGQSTGYTWDPETIVNISGDSDELVEDQYFNPEEEQDHLRADNAQVGSMFGERSALVLFSYTGYAVPRTSYGFVGGTPYEDPEVLVPEVIVEVYKRSFCDVNADFFGGGCTNIFEWYGADISSSSISTIKDGCELGGDGCDTTRLEEFALAVDDNAWTDSFDEMTEEYFDWGAFQTYMCMSWFTQTGDDYVHNLNNIVLMEGEDGLFRFLPYSTDISAGLAWDGAYLGMDLWGWSNMSIGCEYDSSCYEATISRCEEILDFMDILQPQTVIDDLYVEMITTDAPWGDDGGDGMLRSADEEKYAVAYDFYSTRVEAAREELSGYSFPGSGGCEDTGGDTGVVFDTAAPPPGGGGYDTAMPGGHYDTGC